MSTEVELVDGGRRHFLLVATAATGAVGAAMTAVPFLSSWQPSERARALGAPVEADVSKLEVGALLKVVWRGQAIYILRRSQDMLTKLAQHENLLDPDSKKSTQPEYAQNETRARNPEYLVLIGVCTHLGCAPLGKFQPGEVSPDWQGGFYCPCHGSKFDLSGRVFAGVPAKLNLAVPPYYFRNATTLVVGADQEAA